MLKKIGIVLSCLLLFGVLISCESQEVEQAATQQEAEVGNLENDLVIKVDPNSESVFLSGEEVGELEAKFEDDEETEEVYFSDKDEVVQKCLKYKEQLLLIEKSDDEVIAKLKDVLEDLDSNELWDLCQKEFDSFAQDS